MPTLRTRSGPAAGLLTALLLGTGACSADPTPVAASATSTAASTASASTGAPTPAQTTGSPAAPSASSASAAAAAAAGSAAAAASAAGSTAPSGVISVPAALDVAELSTGLTAPWGLGFLPDGTALVTERDSAQLLAVPAGGGSATVLGTVEGVVPGGEGGLLGLAVSPGYAQDGQVFVMYSAADDNRISALTVSGGAITDQQTVLEGLPKGRTHNGGRLAFGPDGSLFAGTGDSGNSDLAQDLGSLGGKILRMQPDGSPVADAPFPQAPLVFSLGHRNVQGLAFDDRGRLWAAEFGQNTWDELNQVVAGSNYGWPVVEGPSDDPAYAVPERTWTPDEASPSGIAIAGGSVFMAGLRGERLWQIPIGENGTDEPVALLTGEYGRLRTVQTAPDGSLWLITSNTDGRGSEQDGDDRILRLSPS